MTVEDARPQSPLEASEESQYKATLVAENRRKNKVTSRFSRYSSKRTVSRMECVEEVIEAEWDE